MSETKKKKVQTLKKVNISALLISAASQGDLESVQKLINSHSLSYCECGSGGYVPLFVAVKSGQVEIAKFLLERGAEVGWEIGHISTPFHLAAEQGYAELVQLILEKNMPVDIRDDRNETPLHLAARGGHVETVDLLLKNNASLTLKNNEGLTPLFLAAEGRHEEVVQMLLKHACANLRTSTRARNPTLLNRILLYNRSNCDKVSELVVQIVRHDVGPSKIVDQLIDHGFVLSHEHINKTLLYQGVKKNCIKLIDSILRSGADLKDAKHSSKLLHTAVKKGHKEMVELLLTSGFDADVKDKKGKTCLCYSLDCDKEDKSAEIIRLLLANGADINEAPELLYEAIDEGLFDVCNVLVKNHVDVNALNSSNETPLYRAVANACYKRLLSAKQAEESTINDIIKLLLNSSNDVIINKHAYKAFHHAVLNGSKEVVLMFLEFGVDIDLGDEDDCSPLCLTSSEGRTDILEILCKNNAEVNLRTCSLSPLQHARYTSDAVTAAMLLKFGADINFYVSDDCDDSDILTVCDKDCKCVIATLKKHIIKMKAAGLAVSEQNLHPDYTPFSDFQEDCKAELDRMKTKKVNAQFSLYDFLVNGKHPSNAKNKSLIGILNRFNFKAFPIYKNLITGNLEISKSRLALLQSGQWALDILVKISSKLNGKKYSFLPAETLEEIVSYLSFREVKNLVYCGKALKRQLRLQC